MKAAVHLKKQDDLFCEKLGPMWEHEAAFLHSRASRNKCNPRLIFQKTRKEGGWAKCFYEKHEVHCWSRRVKFTLWKQTSVLSQRPHIAEEWVNRKDVNIVVVQALIQILDSSSLFPCNCYVTLCLISFINSDISLQTVLFWNQKMAKYTKAFGEKRLGDGVWVDKQSVKRERGAKRWQQ